MTTLLLLPSIVLSNIVFFVLFGDFDHYGFRGFLFWANLLLLVALYVQFLPPALRRERQPMDIDPFPSLNRGAPRLQELAEAPGHPRGTRPGPQ